MPLDQEHQIPNDPRRDDRLGFDEFWCGEHHSSGWEMIASPEMFLAAAAQHTQRQRIQRLAVFGYDRRSRVEEIIEEEKKRETAAIQ